MAKGKKTGGRDIQPGQALPGAGRPPLDPEIRKARAYNRTYVQTKLTELLEYELPQLQAIIKDPKTKVIDAMVASIALYAVKKGDSTRMNFLLDRIIGKVKDEVELSNSSGGTFEIVVRDYRAKTDHDKPDETES